MHFRAEHILAILVTGIFLLVDVAVLCFFVSAFDADPRILQNHASAEHGYIKTPELSPQILTQTTFGGTTQSKVDAVKQLEEALSTQLQTLTQTKPTP